MKLLTKAIEKSLPALRSQDGKGKDAIVRVKFFLESFTWWGLEYDPKERLFFGFVQSSHCPDGEYGYFSLTELEQVRGRFGGVERDLYFSPAPLKNCI